MFRDKANKDKKGIPIMAVHFDFIVSNADAENIMSWINEAKCRTMVRASHALASKDKKLFKELKKCTDYVDKVRAQMKNHREKDDWSPSFTEWYPKLLMVYQLRIVQS